MDLAFVKKALAMIRDKDSNTQLIWIGKNKDRFNLLGEGTYIDSAKKSKDEIIYLIAQAKHNIVGQDLLSWWGAWLNNNQQKFVVAPNQLFKDFRDDSSTIYPELWTKIE